MSLLAVEMVVRGPWARAKVRAAVGLGLWLGLFAGGCVVPLDAGGESDPESGLEGARIAELPLAGDLVPASSEGDEVVQFAAEPGTGGAPRVVYLQYADGKTDSRNTPNPCRGAAPKFVCDFAPTIGECQRQIQSYLDRWYADFNVVFTLTRPASGAYYTEIISSGGGAWCNAADNVAGVAPFLCEDLQGGVAYTFLGGKSAKETAIIIAQEQAHLVGLEHTLSTRDIMDPTICPHCDGFEDVENKIQNDHCARSRQNSYELMKERLGTWKGGIKPTPFGCQPDEEAPAVKILSPADNTAVAETFVLRVQASDACKVKDVQVSVAPMGLHAQSSTAPFEWTLSRINGRQTISVTATDGAGKQTTQEIVVTAGSAALADGGIASDGAAAATDGTDGAGCQVAGCEVASAGGGGVPISQSLGWLAALTLALVILSARPRHPRAAATRHRTPHTPSRL